MAGPVASAAAVSARQSLAHNIQDSQRRASLMGRQPAGCHACGLDQTADGVDFVGHGD